MVFPLEKLEKYLLKLCKDYLDDLLLVPEGKICQTILELYNKDGIVVEPAGAIGISALEMYHEEVYKKKCRYFNLWW